MTTSRVLCLLAVLGGALAGCSREPAPIPEGPEADEEPLEVTESSGEPRPAGVGDE